jgi:hypothetical protein
LLPPTGAVVIASPLKIREGSGSPLRVLALVSSANATATRRVAETNKRVEMRGAVRKTKNAKRKKR